MRKLDSQIPLRPQAQHLGRFLKNLPTWISYQYVKDPSAKVSCFEYRHQKPEPVLSSTAFFKVSLKDRYFFESTPDVLPKTFWQRSNGC